MRWQYKLVSLVHLQPLQILPSNNEHFVPSSLNTMLWLYSAIVCLSLFLSFFLSLDLIVVVVVVYSLLSTVVITQVKPSPNLLSSVSTDSLTESKYVISNPRLFLDWIWDDVYSVLAHAAHTLSTSLAEKLRLNSLTVASSVQCPFSRQCLDKWCAIYTKGSVTSRSS
jgi:hypothetical protein